MEQKVSEKSTSEIIKEYLIEPIGDGESFLIEKLGRIVNYKPISSEALKKDKAIRHVVDEWFSQRIEKKYKRFSSEIFKLQREIEVNEKHFSGFSGHPRYFGKKVKIKIPMLSEARLYTQTEWKAEFLDNNGKLKGSFTYNDDAKFDDIYRPTLFSRVPNLPLEVRKTGRGALAFVYGIYVDAFNTDVISDVLMGSPGYVPYPQYNYVPLKPELSVIWKPKPSGIGSKSKCLDDDSVLALKHSYKYCLVTAWKEAYEEPLMDKITEILNPDFYSDINLL